MTPDYYADDVDAGERLLQAMAGLWRTADNPLHVLVLTDVPLDMPVEELTTNAAERPSFEDRTS